MGEGDGVQHAVSAVAAAVYRRGVGTAAPVLVDPAGDEDAATPVLVRVRVPVARARRVRYPRVGGVHRRVGHLYHLSPCDEPLACCGLARALPELIVDADDVAFGVRRGHGDIHEGTMTPYRPQSARVVHQS